MAKDTNFKFGMHSPRQSTDISPEKNSRKGVWLGSRNAVLRGDMHSNDRLLVLSLKQPQ